MKNFDFKNDFKDWRNFVYKIKLRLNQVEETNEVLERSFRPLKSVTETPSYIDRPILLSSISVHPGHQKTQEKDCYGTFTFLHMLIISKNMKFLRYIIHKKNTNLHYYSQNQELGGRSKHFNPVLGGSKL